MARPDLLEVRRQQALHQLQRTRLRLLVATQQDAHDEAGPAPATHWWTQLQPWLGSALSTLPWLGTALSLFHSTSTPAAPSTQAGHNTEPESGALRPPFARLGQLARQHPLLSIGVVAMGAAVVWHQRRALKQLLATTVLPDMLSSISIQAAPLLASWLQDLLSAQPLDDPPTSPVAATSSTDAPWHGNPARSAAQHTAP